jgi:SAM-dependent methyltransferase
MSNNDIIGFWGETPEKYANLEVENRKTILFPAIIDILKIRQGAKLLDYGGGDGGFLDLVNVKCEKYLYDPSNGMIDFAKANRKTINRFYTEDSKLPLLYFNVISLIHVVTVIKENEELNRIFKKIWQLLLDDGTFIIGMTHPAFKNNFFSTFHTDFSTQKLKFDYLNSHLPYFVHLDTENSKEHISFECYHRPISIVLNMIISCGFMITKVIEVPDKDFKNQDKEFLFPPFLIIECKKQII